MIFDKEVILASSLAKLVRSVISSMASSTDDLIRGVLVVNGRVIDDDDENHGLFVEIAPVIVAVLECFMDLVKWYLRWLWSICV